MSIGPGLPGATLEAYADGFACGQVGTLTVTIDDGDGNNIVGPTTANIIEIECAGNAATYRYLGVFPPDPAESPELHRHPRGARPLRSPARPPGRP